VPGLSLSDISIMIWRKDLLVAGSLRSRRRFVEISLVTAEANPVFNAACRARQEANFVLLFRKVTDVIVGTSRIFVPSGNCFALTTYLIFPVLHADGLLNIQHEAP